MGSLIIDQFKNVIKQQLSISKIRQGHMQTSNKKDSSSNQKGDIFASRSLTTGYFYTSDNQEHNHETQHQQKQQQPASHQQLISPQQSSRRRSKPPSQSTPSKQVIEQPTTQQVTQSQSPQRKPKNNQRRTYKKTTNRRNIQELEEELETLDDEELQKHDIIMLSKESGHNTDRDVKENIEGVFQLDDLQAEYEVEQKVQQKHQKNGKLYQKKKKHPLKIRQQVVFEQFSDQQGQSPQHLQQPHLIPQSSQSISPQKQSPLEQQQNTSQVKEQQSPKNQITKQHMLKILTYPVKPNMLMRTNLQRVNGFIFNAYPEYHVYFQSDKTHLLSAKRVSRTPFSTFIISRSKTNFEQNSEEYLGKAKGSALGDQLNLFGHGFSPANALTMKIKPRQLLASIVYETRIMLAGQPRNFKVYIKKPEVDYYQNFPEVKIYGQQISLNLLYQNPHNRKHIMVLRNKTPQYNSQLKGYSLNFRGRVGLASVKNFVMQKVPIQTLQQKVVQQPKENEQKLPQIDTMIFGKAKDNIFNMDLSSPLYPLIAFGIALSTFDEKYFCE